MGVVLAYIVLSGLVALLTAPWEASDEPDHVRNVETLVAGDAYRIPERPNRYFPSLPSFPAEDAGLEPHQPPLYYLLLAGWQRAFGLEARLGPAPAGSTLVNGFILVPKSGEPLYRHDTPREEEDRRLVTLLRLPGILFGGVAILLTAAAARRLSTDPWTPVVAAAVVASLPKFVFLSAVVNNDNLVHPLAAAGTLLAVTAVARPATSERRRILVAAGLGLILGALVLTKLSAVPLGLGFAFAAFLSARDSGERWRLVMTVGAVALLVSSWWLIRNILWYGSPLANGATRGYLGGFVTPLEPPLKAAFLSIPGDVWKNFWYASGWNHIDWPWWAYIPYWLLAGVCLAGLFRGRRGQRWAQGTQKGVWVLAVLAVSAIATIWVIGLQTSQYQARIAFGGLPALACLIALGLERMRTPVGARFALPVLGFVGTGIAIAQDVVAKYH